MSRKNQKLVLLEGEVDLQQPVPNEMYEAAGLEIPEEPKTYEDIGIAEFFDLVKGAKHKVEDEAIRRQMEYAEKLLRKFKITKQKEAAAKVEFYVGAYIKELKLKNLGITDFVYAMDINEYTKYVNSSTKRHVAFDYLESFEREIPDEIVDKLEALDGIFDRYVIMFTDYTKKTREKAEKKQSRAKKEKDPILFGIFGKWNENGECILSSNRMYVIGDWTDEYCDLTLGRMLTEFAEGKLTPAVGDSVTHPVGEAAESYENFSQDVNNPTAFGSIRVEADDS